MLRFGFPEVTGRRDFRHDLAGPQPRSVDVGDRVFRDSPLFVGRVEDRGAVTRTAIVPLPIDGGRIVDLEKELEQPAVRDLTGIEDDLDGLGVSAVIAVRRIGDIAPRIADAGGDDPGIVAEQLLNAPKTSAGEYGPFTRFSHFVSPFRTLEPDAERDRFTFAYAESIALGRIPPQLAAVRAAAGERYRFAFDRDAVAFGEPANGLRRNGVLEIGDRAATGTAEVRVRAGGRLIYRRRLARHVDLHHRIELVQPNQAAMHRGKANLGLQRAGAHPDFLGGQVAAGSGFLDDVEDGPVVRREVLNGA